jgi:CRISPR/Cas system-associated protein Cas10 (large subunit of type III CRISPR-Cas system)
MYVVNLLARMCSIQLLALSFLTCATCGLSQDDDGTALIARPRRDSDLTEYIDKKYGFAVKELLRNEEARKLIDASDGQVDDILKRLAAIGRETSMKIKDIIKSRKENESDEDFKTRHFREILEEHELSQNKIREAVSEVFLPHQEKELNRILVWTVINQLGRFVSVFQLAFVKEAVELGQDDLDKLEIRSRELETEFSKDVEQLREKYRKKLIDELEPGKREKFRELLGKPMAFENKQISF